MMQQNTTRAVAEALLQFMATRNLEPLTNLFAERVDWFIPGDVDRAPWVGIKTSKAEIREFYQLLWKNTKPISADIDKLVTDDKDVMIIGEFKTRMLATNKIVDSFFCIHATIENNLIVRYRLFEDTYAVSQALTGSK